MKKVLIAALAAIAVLTGFTEAKAQGFPHWVFDQGKFRSHSATGFAGVPGAISDLGTQDAFDSTYASGIAKFDTTASFSTAGWAPPPGIASAIDSCVYAKLFVFDAGLANVSVGKTSATAESIYIQPQVSANNADWHSAAVLPGHAPVIAAFTVQTTVNASVVTFTSSTNTALSGKMWSLAFNTNQAAGAGLRSAQDINHLWQFPYVRFIIMGSRSLNHSYKVTLAHWSTNPLKQVDQ